MEQNAVSAGGDELRKRKHPQLDDDLSRRTSAMSPKDNGGSKSRKTKVHDIELEQMDANVTGSITSSNSAGTSRDTTSSGNRKKGKRKV